MENQNQHQWIPVYVGVRPPAKLEEGQCCIYFPWFEQQERRKEPWSIVPATRVAVFPGELFWGTLLNPMQSALLRIDETENWRGIPIAVFDGLDHPFFFLPLEPMLHLSLKEAQRKLGDTAWVRSIFGDPNEQITKKDIWSVDFEGHTIDLRSGMYIAHS